MVAKKSSKKSIKKRPSLFLKKVKKYATKSNAYKALLAAGALGLIGAVISKKKINVKVGEAELVDKIRAIKKETEECYAQILKSEKEYPARLEEYNNEAKKEMLKYIEGVRQIAQTANAKNKRKQEGGGLDISVHPEHDLFYYTKKLEKCKQARENQIKAFVQKVGDIERKIKSIKNISMERKIKLMENMRRG